MDTEQRVRATALGTFVVTTTILTGNKFAMTRANGWVFAAEITVNSGATNLDSLKIEGSVDGTRWCELVHFNLIGSQAVGTVLLAKVAAGAAHAQINSITGQSVGTEADMMLPFVRVIADGAASVNCTIVVSAMPL